MTDIVARVSRCGEVTGASVGDDVLEIDIAGSFDNGRVGFYNFSQADVVYSAFSIECTASFGNYGDGTPGTLGVPALR